MTPHEILAQAIRDFRYVSDAARDHWQIGPMSGAFRGDCEDFALTLLLRLMGSNAAMWHALERGEAEIIHVLSDRGNGHAVLWVSHMGYVDSIHQHWRDDILFRRQWTYSPSMIRDKLRGKNVPSPKDKKRGSALILIGVLALAVGAAGFMGVF